MKPPKAFHLQVLTPTQVLVSVDGVSKANVRLADGAGIGILPGHAPLIAETVSGPLHYTDSSGPHAISLVAGILQIEKNQVTILTQGQAEEGAAARRPGTEAAMRYDRITRAHLKSQQQKVFSDESNDRGREST